MITISSEPGSEIGNIKSVQQKQAQNLQNEEKHHQNIEDRIRE
jgi:hypothetical protein